MIKPNELRLGVYVTDEEHSCEGKISKMQVYDTISSSHLEIVSEDNERHQLLYPYPIALSEKRLLKFGFDKKPNGLFALNYFWVEVGVFGLITPVYCDGTSFMRHIGKYFKSVHQLQNAYFALTGEELTYAIS